MTVILGGAHSTYIKRRIEDIDAIFVGEGEDTLLEWLDYRARGGIAPMFEIHPVTNKKLYRTPRVKKYEIQTCNFMWSIDDCIVRGETLPLETSRGCIFRCKFCVFPHLGKKKMDYLKSTDQIRAHLINNWEQFGTTQYTMMDDTFNDSEYKINEFLKMTQTLPFKLEYGAYIRADLVCRFEGMAEKLVESGLRGAFFGIESLHPTASVVIGKGWSGKEAREYIPTLVHTLWNDKVSVQCGLIVGLPGETHEDLYNTLQWANDNNINVIFFGLQVTNNLHERVYISEFERNAEQYGFKFDNLGKWFSDDWSRDTVVDVALQLNRGRTKLNYSGFINLALRSLNFTHEEIESTHSSKMVQRNPTFRTNKQQFLDEYFHQLTKVCNNAQNNSNSQ